METKKKEVKIISSIQKKKAFLVLKKASRRTKGGKGRCGELWAYLLFN